jgi:hypothetical protein
MVPEEVSVMSGYLKYAACLALIVASAASAKENYQEKAFNADTPEKFELVSANVRKAMEPGGRYEYVKPEERKTIEKKLDEIGTLFQKNGSVDAMSQETKIELFNAQEVVNSILTRRDGERVICKKEAPIGSHIPITTCHTYAQEEDAHRNSSSLRNGWSNMQCGDSGHGMCGFGEGNAAPPRTK